MASRDTSPTNSMALSDKSPLVSSEIAPGYESYGAVDSPVFLDDETPTSGDINTSKEHETSMAAEDAEDRAMREAKYQTLYKRNHDTKGHISPAGGQKKTHRYLEKLREMPWPMKQKLSEAKRVRAQLGKDYFKAKERRNFVKTGTKTLQKGKRRFESEFGLFDKSIKKITAYFGSGVASYFIFLRRILWMDLAIALVCIGFICVPQIVIQEGTVLDLTENGLGILQNSIAFYGYYEAAESFEHYAMPLAYLLTVLVVLAVSVISIVIWMSVSYWKSKLAETEIEYTYGRRVFSGWDFSISRSDGILDRQLAIKTDFQEIIWEEKLSIDKGCAHKCCLYSVRVITNLVVLGLLGGSGYAIYYVSQYQFEENIFGDYQNLVEQYKLSFAVAALKLCMPMVLQFIAFIEDWAPRFDFNITLARTTFFYFASLLVFILSLFAAFRVETSTEGCQNLTSSQPIAPVVPEEELVTCWETEIGEEIFKLILIDFGASLGVVFVFDILRAMLVKCNMVCSRITYKSFDVTAGVLDVVYCQGLIWLGVYFSPVVPLFGVIKFLMTFGIRYAVARLVNVPPKKLYKASRSGNFNMAILLANLFVCMYPLMLILFELRPSNQCGPFRTYCRVYEVLTTKIGEVPDWLGTVLEFVCSPQVVIPVLILLLLAVIYYKTKSSAYKNVIRELRDQLNFERRDVRRQVFNVARTANTKAVEKSAAYKTD